MADILERESEGSVRPKRSATFLEFHQTLGALGARRPKVIGGGGQQHHAAQGPGEVDVLHRLGCPCHNPSGILLS